MSNHTAKHYERERKIDGIDVTTDILSGRGGLTLFVRYLCGVGILDVLARHFQFLRRSTKRQPVGEIFKQLLCWFLDGTSRHLTWFDQTQKDPGYAAVIESKPEQLLSSHAVKRFLGLIGWPYYYWFRRLLQQMFLWRLQKENPAVIVLGIDTMVMDNDDALQREGVSPTYKKKKGFQPLHLSWGRFIVDSVFRSGYKHSNHGDTVSKTILHIVKFIRQKYSQRIPIIIRMDSGFMDQKLFRLCEEEGIGYICAGKLYDDTKEMLPHFLPECWRRYGSGRDSWRYLEFGERRQSWKRIRRSIFCQYLHDEQGQQYFEFARPDTLLYTNLGMGDGIDALLREAGQEHWFTSDQIIGSYHSRGADELVHRALKEFRAEQLPFKKFGPNAAFYYLMLTAFFLYEAFKEDVCAPVIAVTAYATTLRRRILDIAAKIVRHAHKITLKLTAAAWDALNFPEMWQRSGSPPPLIWQ